MIELSSMDHKISQIILALDNMSADEAMDLCAKLPQELFRVKVGLELYLRYGRDFVIALSKKHQKKIFLDLKLHDIPNTVKKSISSLSDLPIEFLTIHLSGGREMVREANKALATHLPEAKLLGVSYLTSLGNEDLKELWNISPHDKESAFTRLFNIALEEKIAGAVLSPHELPLLEGQNILKVTPGIRLSNSHDQKRVMTPKEALDGGANFLVIGREITEAPNPTQKIEEIWRHIDSN